MNEPQSDLEQTPSGNGYDKSEISLKSVFGWIVAVVLIVVIFLVLLNEYFLAVKEDLVQEMVLAPESLPLRDLRAREDEVLNSYKLLDSAGGVYRIPIERAMELVVESTYVASGK